MLVDSSPKRDGSPTPRLAERISSATLHGQRLHLGPSSHPERTQIALRDWQRRQQARVGGSVELAGSSRKAAGHPRCSSAEYLRAAHFANNVDVLTYVSPYQSLSFRPISYESPQRTPCRNSSGSSERRLSISPRKEGRIVTPFRVPNSKNKQSGGAWVRDALASRNTASASHLRKEAIRSRTEAIRLRSEMIDDDLAAEAEVLPLPDGWMELKESSTQLVYYLDRSTWQTTWTRPTNHINDDRNELYL